MPQDRRHNNRRKFGYYMPITEETTQQLIGHLADISSDGFRIDSSRPIPENRTFRLMLSLTSEIALKPFLHFNARSKWCKSDAISPNMYYVGFEITSISVEDANIFKRIFEKYGS